MVELMSSYRQSLELPPQFFNQLSVPQSQPSAQSHVSVIQQQALVATEQARQSSCKQLTHLPQHFPTCSPQCHKAYHRRTKRKHGTAFPENLSKEAPVPAIVSDALAVLPTVAVGRFFEPAAPSSPAVDLAAPIENTEDHRQFKEPAKSSSLSDEGTVEDEEPDVEIPEAQLSGADYVLEVESLESEASKLLQRSISTASEQHPDDVNDRSEQDAELPQFVPHQPMQAIISVEDEQDLPPVAPLYQRVAMNYMKISLDERKRLRRRNHYEGQRTATDRRFWTIEQQDLYTSIYHQAIFGGMKWIDWEHIDRVDQFVKIREKCAHLGLEYVMSYHCDWDTELIKQFYSTVYINLDKTSITWMSDGNKITANKRAWEELFKIPDGVHTDIHAEAVLEENDQKSMYTAAVYNLGSIHGLSPLASIANRILRTTIYPRTGDKCVIHTHNWNVLYHIVHQQPFDIIAIDLLICGRPKNLLYAPYVMGMIERAFVYNGPRDFTHLSYKPNKSTSAGPIPVVDPLAAPIELPSPVIPTEVAAVGLEAQPEVAEEHSQFEAMGQQLQTEAVQEQIVPVRHATPADLEAFRHVVEDGLKSIVDRLGTVERKVDRLEEHVTLLKYC